MRYYTGIGHRDRNLTKEGRYRISIIADKMRELGYTLLSGNADGSDHAFDMSSGGNSILYLPYEGFNSDIGHPSSKKVILDNSEKDFASRILYEEAILPEIKSMSHSNRQYHLRNFYQVYNKGVLSDVVFYFAKENSDGKIEGGTRTAVYSAHHFGIPTFNLISEEGFHDALDFIRGLK